MEKPCGFLPHDTGQTLASDVEESRQQAATDPKLQWYKEQVRDDGDKSVSDRCCWPVPHPTAKRIVLTRQQDLHGGSSWNGHSTPRQQGMFLQHICIIYPSAAMVGAVATWQRSLELHTVLKTYGGFFKFGKHHVKVLLPVYAYCPDVCRKEKSLKRKEI